MSKTSGTYGFLSIEIELIIREAYERIGIMGEMVETQKLESARRAIDLLMLEWMNKTVNLWTLKSRLLGLTASQGVYGEGVETFYEDIIQVNLRTSTRQLNGTAASSSGIAANAFDGNPNTACTQNAPNGNISYDYGAGNTQQLTFIGVASAINANYTLVIEYSNDGMNWQHLDWSSTLFYDPIDNISFPYRQIIWGTINKPVTAQYYRIRETGGATLDIQEIYFNNNIFDYVLSKVSRDEYYSYPNKTLEGRPTVYYFDRQIEPVLYLWPVPNAQYNCLQYTCKQMMQETGILYSDTIDMPARFYPALIAGVTYNLALKFQPERAQLFKSIYEEAFALAATEDTEGVTMTIYGDTTYYYGM